MEFSDLKKSWIPVKIEPKKSWDPYLYDEVYDISEVIDIYGHCPKCRCGEDIYSDGYSGP